MRNRGFERVILDQGVVQELWSVTLTGSRWSPEALDEMLRGLFAATAVSPALVYLDVGIDEAAARLRQRPIGTSRFDRMGLAQVRELLSSREARLKQLFERAVALTGAPWCRIDGERAVEDVCADVTAFVNSIGDG
jgi:thymidylate kinase